MTSPLFSLQWDSTTAASVLVVNDSRLADEGLPLEEEQAVEVLIDRGLSLSGDTSDRIVGGKGFRAAREKAEPVIDPK